MKRRAAAAKSGGDQHKLTLHHQRLYQALDLGLKYFQTEGKKWQCTDIEIQRLAIRSISAFVGCISPDIVHLNLVKDSTADMLVALIGIIEFRKEAVLGVAAEVTLTFVKVLGSLISFAQLSKLIGSFSCLLSFPQNSVAASCANVLNHIFLKLVPSRPRSQDEIWEILTESKAVDCIICNLLEIFSGSKPYEIFPVMTSLLKTILMRWPPSRYAVWSNPKLMQGLETKIAEADSSVKVVLLQLYSAIALCGSGTNKLLQEGETFLSMILRCMGSSQPHCVRVEAFKLTQCLVRSEQGWVTVARTCCDSIVKAIIDAMGGWNLSSGKVSSDKVPLLTEACKLASITRWAGEHHTYFWKCGIDKVLLNLIYNFYIDRQASISLTPAQLVAAARKGLDANYLEVLRPYIWDTLGWLATHCPENFNPDLHGNNYLRVLIACGCVILMDAVLKGQQRFLYEFSVSKIEPASRAVLLMIHSPCKYIASQTREIISVLPTPDVKVYLIHALGTINSISTGNDFMVVNKDQTITDLIILSCLSACPKYQSFIFQWDGIKILSIFAKWCLSNNADDAPQFQLTSNYSTCCMLDKENWEGGDTLLFFSLWGLVELIQHSRNIKDLNELMSQVVGGIQVGGWFFRTLIDKLQKISSSASSGHGLRWCATYILSLFGFYGFPSRFGKRIGKALSDKELADVHLRLSNGECLRVHSVILMARCPSMLLSGESSSNKRTDDELGEDTRHSCENFQREVRLSARVDHTTLIKLLEFVYTGFVQVDEDLVKQLRLLARGCDFHCLSNLLARKCLKWGTTMFDCNLTAGLGISGHQFSDIILEAKADDLVEWTCTHCFVSLPHVHVHKIILWSSCDYFKALLQSGMQESHSQNIKVPISWEALTKLVNWFYCDELPKPSSGCIWTNMDVDHQLKEVHPYVELCWLAEFWLMVDLRVDAISVVISCVRSSKNLPLKIIQTAFELSQWEIVEVAVNCLAPLYPHLRDSDGLLILNDELVDMVRVAYVQLTQSGDSGNSD